VDGDPSFAADGQKWKTPARDDPFRSGRDPREYDRSEPQNFADLRSSNAAVGDQNQGPGRILNDAVGRYPPLHDTRPFDTAPGLCLPFRIIQFCRTDHLYVTV